MIQSNELRIGNLVKDRGGKTLRIDWFENSKVCQDMGYYESPPFGKVPYHPLTEDFECLQPIPLSEEVLLKCGFIKKTNDFDLYIDNWLTISLEDTDFSLELYSKDKNSITPALWIKHLHQLQNLYFALTNQELQINL